MSADDVYRAARADAGAQREKLRVQREQLQTTIATRTGEARVKLQAALDKLDAQIAAGEAAIDDPFVQPGADEVELS
jgi:chromosome condensin MukBEF ATPase and DNA-binding subunit MukB